MRPPGLLARGWLWLLDYLYAGYWQARGMLQRSDPERYLDPARAGQPVLLLPGVYERWQFLRPLADALAERGHPIHVVPDLGWNTRTVAASADVVGRYLDERDLRDVLVVAHSKGGLIGKHAMLQDPHGRIDRMIAIATPFAGSVYARLFVVPSIRAFSPRDRTLRMLAGQLDVNARITSVWGAFDPHIPGGSRLDGATNVVLRTSGHFRILRRSELVDAVVAAARRPGQ
jgi:pimeloyl-ACP methyl ester carboxylesterase